MERSGRLADEIDGVIVIGAGAAGIMAALRAAECGAPVLLLEKTERLGTKILISGGGKCNVTHAGPMEHVRSAFRRNEALFLKPCFYKYSNQDFVRLLQLAGLNTSARSDGRIFPQEPGNAKDVVAALEHLVRRAGIEVWTDSAVTSLRTRSNGLLEIELSGGKALRASQVIVAVGGSSYPATGTTGDGWHWAESLGHTINAPRAALAPIYLTDAHPDWSGVALRDVELLARVSSQGKIYARWRGDLLFTHKGISGPCALGISREIAELSAARGPAIAGGILLVDICPGQSFEALAAQLRSEATQSPRKTVASLLAELVPNRLVDTLADRATISKAAPLSQLGQKAVTELVRHLKEFSLGAVKAVPLERGEVVAGGVSLDEVNPQTMESKLVPGLLFCGEVLDIAGPVGGYNLQAAWSTGYVAGETAARIRAERPALSPAAV